jgi:putative pyrroloquinoline-quinone binding quinoprotein
VAVIELDLYAPSGPEPQRPRWHPARYRAAALTAILLLTLSLGGAAVPRPQLWQPGGTLPMTPDGSFQLVDGRLFTFDRIGTRFTTTAWAPSPVRRLWRHDSTIAVAGDAPQEFGWFVRPVGDAVVLQVGRTTTVLDATTGAVRWQRGTPVSPVDGRYGVAYDETFRPGDHLDADDHSDGVVFYGTDGAFHSDPPAHTDLRVIDLATGAVRWTAGFDSGAVATGVPGVPGEVLLYTRTGFSLRDLATGAVRASRTVQLPPDSDAVFGLPMTADLMLIAGAGSVTAYSVRTLAPMWRRERPSSTDGDISVCGDLPCIERRGGVTALDPATGRDRWTIDMNAGLHRYGPDVYVLENVQSRVIEVRDPASGALRADLRAWGATSVPGSQDPVVLSRAELGGVVFALLRPYGRIQPLGRSEAPVTECQNDARVVVCRTPYGAQAWTYHA